MGTITNCDNTAPNLIVNKIFECGYSNNWEVYLASGIVATFTDATTDSNNGNIGVKVVVSTTTGVFNKVILKKIRSILKI